MSYLDKFYLPKTSKKIICPQCRQKTFKPYYDRETELPVNEYAFGRCDRQNECGYHAKPDLKGGAGKKTLVKKTIYPDEQEINKSLHKSPTNLHKFLATKGIPENCLYDNGVFEGEYKTKSGNISRLTVYVFRNADGKLCNIKYFKYKENGKRDHDFQSFSLKQPEQRNQYIEERYTMPLFGEHELDPDKKKIVCVVESEKTKVICKFHYPEFDWVACGSANGLSDGTDDSADKIKPLKGRTVYWVGDADKASRGKFLIEEKTGKETWQWCSSIRNGIKHIDDFHVVDLFPDRDDGYDLGDSLLDGVKPEIKPTWSKKQQDKRFQSYIPPSDYKVQEALASQVGETSAISDEFDNTFSWMRTHCNAFYGWSNDGKGTMLDFLSLVKQRKSGWKRCAFKQEDMGSYFNNGRAKITADRIYAKMVWTITGKVPHVFEKFALKNSCPILPKDEYYEIMKWVKEHNYIVYPTDRRYKNIFDEFLYFYEVFGIDIFEIDPWNTVLLDDIERGDERLVKALMAGKEFVLKTNTILNIVNHAGSKHEVKDKGGAFRVVTQFMQLGGSGWDMKMDGQFSIHRPFRHKLPNDPRVHFWNLKQRDSEITGAERGVYKKIEFDKKRRQYYFDGVCPIDGSTKQPITDAQQSLDYIPSWKKSKKKKDASFEEHLRNDWGDQSVDSDMPDWVKG